MVANFVEKSQALAESKVAKAQIFVGCTDLPRRLHKDDLSSMKLIQQKAQAFPWLVADRVLILSSLIEDRSRQ